MGQPVPEPEPVDEDGDVFADVGVDDVEPFNPAAWLAA